MSGLDDLIKGATGGQGGLGDLLGGLAAGGAGGGLGDILGGLAGGGAKASAGGMGGLLGSLLPMLGAMLAGGGLQKTLAGFQANGLSAQADSWVSTGTNEPISGADVREVVEDEEIARIASELGVSEDEAAAAVAAVLPEVVDKVTPDGKLPPDNQLDAAFGALKQLRNRAPATG